MLRKFRILFFVPFFGMIFGFVNHNNDKEGTDKSGFQLSDKPWKFGVHYTYLPLPKIDEGTLEYGNLGFNFDYEIKSGLWLGAGLGVAYREYHIRSVTRTIDHILIDPITNALSYTFIDSIYGVTNKLNFINIPAGIRFDLINKSNQTVFISSGGSFNIAFRELNGFEDIKGSRKTISSPDSFTHSTFGIIDLGYEYKQFRGISTVLSLQYRRTLYSRGIPDEGKNYFGFKVGICFSVDQTEE